MWNICSHLWQFCRIAKCPTGKSHETSLIFTGTKLSQCFEFGVISILFKEKWAFGIVEGALNPSKSPLIVEIFREDQCYGIIFETSKMVLMGTVEYL